VTKVLLWVPEVPSDCRDRVAELLRVFGIAGTWYAQPLAELSWQIKLEAQLEAHSISLLASRLSKTTKAFELTSLEPPFEQYLFHVGLGIKRFDLNPAGQVLLPADAIEAALMKSAGNLKEFQSRLRLLQGTAWIDLMESYRHDESVRLLPFAV
jgi:hypothetical protein